MKSKLMGLIALMLTLGILFPLVASATLLELVASTQAPNQVSNFDVFFNDIVGDGVLRLNEVTSFSGVNFPCTPGCDVFETKLLLVPNIAGVSSGSGSDWGFGNDCCGTTLQAAAASILWTYATAPAPPSVPEPATLLLLALGVAGVGFMTRRKVS